MLIILEDENLERIKQHNEDDVRDVLALMMVVGLGSLERGKFRIDRAEIGLKKHMPRKPPARPEERVNHTDLDPMAYPGNAKAGHSYRG